MRKRLICFLLVSTAVLANTAAALPIGGFGDPRSNPLLTAGDQEGFDSVAAGDYASLTLGNVTYSGIGGAFTIGNDFNGLFNTSGGQSLFNGFDDVPDTFRFDFAAPVDAFAFNWGAADNTWLLQAFDGAGAVLASLDIPQMFGNNGRYVGLSATGIDHAVLTNRRDLFPAADFVFIDRFTWSPPAPAAVPEPSTLALFGLGMLALCAVRRKGARSTGSSAAGVLLSLALASGPAAAQITPPLVEQPTEILQPPAGYPSTTATSAVGPYLATPAWDQKLPTNVRFVVLTNFNSTAVLDRETGLVWARQPILSAASADPEMAWVAATFGCTSLSVGGRGGWRLPRADELQSLVDFSIPQVPNALRLPAGHPFLLHPPSVEYYWTSEYLTPVDEAAWVVSLISGLPTLTSPQITSNHAAALCVRGR